MPSSPQSCRHVLPCAAAAASLTAHMPRASSRRRSVPMTVSASSAWWLVRVTPARVRLGTRTCAAHTQAPGTCCAEGALPVKQASNSGTARPSQVRSAEHARADPPTFCWGSSLACSTDSGSSAAAAASGKNSAWAARGSSSGPSTCRPAWGSRERRGALAPGCRPGRSLSGGTRRPPRPGHTRERRTCQQQRLQAPARSIEADLGWAAACQHAGHRIQQGAAARQGARAVAGAQVQVVSKSGIPAHRQALRRRAAQRACVRGCGWARPKQLQSTGFATPAPAGPLAPLRARGRRQARPLPPPRPGREAC